MRILCSVHCIRFGCAVIFIMANSLTSSSCAWIGKMGFHNNPWWALAVLGDKLDNT